MAARLMPKPLAAAPSKSAPLALGDEEVVPLAEDPVLLEEEVELAKGKRYMWSGTLHFRSEQLAVISSFPASPPPNVALAPQ